MFKLLLIIIMNCYNSGLSISSILTDLKLGCIKSFFMSSFEILFSVKSKESPSKFGKKSMYSGIFEGGGKSPGLRCGNLKQRVRHHVS